MIDDMTSSSPVKPVGLRSSPSAVHATVESRTQ
jgi:hypothetical protein